MPLQAITFDAGGTLIEPSPSVGHVYSEVAARHGVRGASPAVLNRRFAAAWGSLHEFNYSRAEWAALVDQVFEGLTEKPPSQTFFSELYARFAEPDTWRVFEDVLPALEALASRGLKLGVISNWDERLRPLLRRLKLSDHFDAVVVSGEVGVPKPSPVMFEHAARQLALPPSPILHVGDSLATDVVGARAAGFQALLLDRHTPKAPGQIHSLRDLLRSESRL